MSTTWNPWHGCHKISEGCRNCYVYERDKSYGRNASVIEKSKRFDKLLHKYYDGQYKTESGEKVYTCMTSDFFLEDADEWRAEAWDIIRLRNDLYFEIFTKRVNRIADCLPSDWGDGYDNVCLICSVENQEQCDKRLPIFKSIKAKHKMIACAPLLENIDITNYLGPDISLVSACGENGQHARECHYEWVLSLRQQCEKQEIPFHFSKTGTYFIFKGKKYFIPFGKQAEQAQKSNLDYLLKK